MMLAEGNTVLAGQAISYLYLQKKARHAWAQRVFTENRNSC
jgi:hypothetical protein